MGRWVLTGTIGGAVAALLWAIPAGWAFLLAGALWGTVLAATLGRASGATVLLGALLFGAVVPTVVSWLFTGIAPGGLLFLLNAAWGLATGITLVLFGRARRPSPPAEQAP